MTATRNRAAGRVRPLRENLNWLLARAARTSKDAEEQRLAELGTCVRGHIVLTAIHEGAPNQLAIAHKAGLDKATLGPVIDQLEKDRLIERHPDPADRRARIVTLTDAGRTLLGQTSPAIQDIEADLLSDLSPEEKKQFLTLLTQVVEGRMADLPMSGSCL